MWLWKGLPWTSNYFSCAWCWSEMCSWVCLEQVVQRCCRIFTCGDAQNWAKCWAASSGWSCWRKTGWSPEVPPTSTILGLILWNRLSQEMGKDQRKRVTIDQTENYLLPKKPTQNKTTTLRCTKQKSFFYMPLWEDLCWKATSSFEHQISGYNGSAKEILISRDPQQSRRSLT